MALLQAPVNNSNPFAEVIGDGLAPAGTYVSTVLDVKDEFGVERLKYQSTEKELVDLTCFLFGFRDAQGRPHRVSSKRMKISGNEKSALFGFLKSLLGQAPQYGWDYCELKGRQCLLTVEHIARHDGSGVFAGIAALSPVPSGFAQGGATPGQAGMGQPARPQTADYRPQTGEAMVAGEQQGTAVPTVTAPVVQTPPVVQPVQDVPFSADDPIPF